MVVVGVDNNNNNNNNKWSKQSFIIYKRLTMPKIVNGKKIYSAAEKAAYYKRKAIARKSVVPYVSGKGAYKINYSRFKRNYNKPYKYAGAGRKIGNAIGTAIGGLAGNPAVGGAIGAAVGHGAHALMKTVTGFGDYNVSKNSLVYNSDAVPQFTGNDRCTVISHREFVGDIRGSTNFEIATYDINPANSQLFPWLSGIAQNYEEWVAQGIIFEFKTTCATAVASTNTALGTVVMATQYNSYAPQFINKQQMENYEFCQSTVPSASILHPVECDPKMTANGGLFYVNNDGYAANADQRLYNIGKFNIATIGMQAAATIGELWVTYKICFMKPKLQSNVSFSDHYILDATNISSATPFGTSAAITMSNSSSSYPYKDTDQANTALITSPWSGVTSNQYLYINPNFVGRLLIVYQLAPAAGGSYVDPTITVFGNCSIVSTPALNYGFVNSPKQYLATENDQQYCFLVNCTGGTNGVIYPYIQFSAGTVSGAGGSANLAIYSVPSNLIN